MKNRAFLFVLAATAYLAMGPLCAEPKGAGNAAPTPDLPIAFDGPRVMKLSWSTSSLIAADFDGDGRQDIALINSAQARIDLLYQLKPGEKPRQTARPVSSSRWEPELDDAPFQKASIVTGQTMHALAAGDFDGDRRMDIAYTNDQGRLVIRYQDEDEAWTRRTEFEIGTSLPYEGTLIAADIDRDKRTDLVVLADKAIHLLDQSGKDPGLKRRARLPMDESEPYNLGFADLDGDGREDIYYLVASLRESVIVRRQDKNGSFVLEEAYDLEGATRSDLVTFPPGDTRGTRKMPDRPHKRLLRIHDGTGLVELRSMTYRPDPSHLGLNLPFQRYAAPVESLKTTSFAIGNFDQGNDVALGDGEGAQVWILANDGDGRYRAPVSFPTYGGLSDMTTMASGTAGKLDSLVVLSQREKALGVMRRPDVSKPFGYPEPLPIVGTPLAVAVVPHQNTMRIVCVTESEKKRRLEIFEPSGENYIARPPMPLPSVISKPRALRPFDFNQDGISDLLMFSADEPLRVFLQNPEGAFAEFVDQQGLSGSLVDKLDASAVTGADFDGDGKQELVIARKRFARALRINAIGRVEVVGQFTADDELADLGFALLLSGTSGEALIAYDLNRARLLRAERDALGMFRQKTSVEVRLPRNANPVTATQNAGYLLFVGGNTLQVARPGGMQWFFGLDASYETDLEGVAFQFVAAGRFVQDSIQVLALDSTRTRVLEILQPPRPDEKTWRSLMYFRVFEQDPHYRGKTGASEEPHNTLVEDVTGDGRNDIVLLVHDRLLLYSGRE